MEIYQRLFEQLMTIKDGQQHLAQHLDISPKTVSAWKQRGSDPPAKLVPAIASFLRCTEHFLLTGEADSIQYTADESAIVDYYRRLNPEHRDYIKGKMVELYRALDSQPVADAQPTLKIVSLFHVQEDEQDSHFVRELPVYEACASAGTGQPIDMSRYENVTVGDDVPLNANFGVPLAGDSMEPTYPDGSIVWVKQQRTIEDGQIGIFYWDGQMYCKQLRKTKSGIALVSLNRNYRTILIGDTSELVCYGRVVAVSEAT